MNTEIDIQEELNLKVLKGVEATLTQFGTGALSGQQANAALAAIFDCSSGLVSPDVFEIISQASAELPKETECKRRLFVNAAGDLVEIDYTFGDFKLRVKSRKVGEPNGWTTQKEVDCSEAPVPFMEAKQKLERFANSLLSKGYRELT